MSASFDGKSAKTLWPDFQGRLFAVCVVFSVVDSSAPEVSRLATFDGREFRRVRPSLSIIFMYPVFPLFVTLFLRIPVEFDFICNSHMEERHATFAGRYARERRSEVFKGTIPIEKFFSSTLDLCVGFFVGINFQYRTSITVYQC